jgi:hypothetical protein
MIRSGMGTPRSQKSPYFIEFTQKPILFANIYADQKSTQNSLGNYSETITPTRGKHRTRRAIAASVPGCRRRRLRTEKPGR